MTDAYHMLVRENERLQARNAELERALRVIGTECSNYVAPATCRSSGRIEGAEYEADAMCDQCIAREALTTPPASGHDSGAGERKTLWTARASDYPDVLPEPTPDMQAALDQRAKELAAESDERGEAQKSLERIHRLVTGLLMEIDEELVKVGAEPPKPADRSEPSELPPLSDVRLSFERVCSGVGDIRDRDKVRQALSQPAPAVPGDSDD